eukprot:11940847-Heterocapsa_arctica.AAC.1
MADLGAGRHPRPAGRGLADRGPGRSRTGSNQGGRRPSRSRACSPKAAAPIFRGSCTARSRC